jgi:tRNA G18 (ribose-2'-O)-methylase SpoU
VPNPCCGVFVCLWSVVRSIAPSTGSEVVGSKARIVLVLDQVMDPQNLGALLRGSRFFGTYC